MENIIAGIPVWVFVTIFLFMAAIITLVLLCGKKVELGPVKIGPGPNIFRCEERWINKEIEQRLKEEDFPSSVYELLEELKKDPKTDQEKLIGIFKLYTFGGLKKKTRTSEEGLFQNFDVKGKNINAIYYLWADVSKRSWIHASIENDEKDPYLSVAFKNSSEAWASNIAIRAQDEMALSNVAGKELFFEARILEDAPQEELKISVRIMNGWFQHWKPMQGAAVRYFKVTKSWNAFHVLLKAGEWQLFESDGNRFYAPQQADFSIIMSVIFIFGRDRPDFDVESKIGIKNIRIF